MGNRLTRIYTRTGDGGETGLADGTRISKDAPRIVAIGDVDELNSAIGIVLGQELPGRVKEALLEVQNDLFDLGGELSLPGALIVTADQGAKLEGWIDEFNTDLPPLKEFILPSGGAATAACHLARAICRRAERALVGLAGMETVNGAARIYLNRLSDLLFVIARTLAREKGQGEVYWRKPTRP
jgi:cob(I)alamin adenosyltransferase